MNNIMREVTPTELQELIETGQVHLVDVREPYENDEFNIGGTNIPLGEISMHIDDLKALGADREIVLYCRSGNRSAMAQKLLSMQFGINNTINLKGGVIAWKQELGE